MSSLQRALVSEAVGRELLRTVAEHLGAAGIDLMPLKGVWLQRCAYPEPGERAVTDVDVLVQERDYARSLALLAQHGWRPRSWNVSEAALRHREWALPLDLHRRLFTPGAYRLPAADLFARGRRDSALFGTSVVLPDPMDVLAHLIGHFVKSRRRPDDAAATRDFAVLAQRLALDPGACARHLHRAGLGRASRYVLANLADDGCELYARLLRALPSDPAAAPLVALARRIAAQASVRSQRGAFPGFLLDRTLTAGAWALLRRVGDLPLERSMPTNLAQRGL